MTRRRLAPPRPLPRRPRLHLLHTHPPSARLPLHLQTRPTPYPQPPSRRYALSVRSASGRRYSVWCAERAWRDPTVERRRGGSTRDGGLRGEAPVRASVDVTHVRLIRRAGAAMHTAGRGRPPRARGGCGGAAVEGVKEWGGDDVSGSGGRSARGSLALQLHASSEGMWRRTRTMGTHGEREIGGREPGAVCGCSCVIAHVPARARVQLVTTGAYGLGIGNVWCDGAVCLCL